MFGDALQAKIVKSMARLFYCSCSWSRNQPGPQNGQFWSEILYLSLFFNNIFIHVLEMIGDLQEDILGYIGHIIVLNNLFELCIPKNWFLFKQFPEDILKARTSKQLEWFRMIYGVYFLCIYHQATPTPVPSTSSSTSSRRAVAMVATLAAVATGRRARAQETGGLGAVGWGNFDTASQHDSCKVFQVCKVFCTILIYKLHISLQKHATYEPPSWSVATKRLGPRSSVVMALCRRSRFVIWSWWVGKLEWSSAQNVLNAE